MCADLLFAIFFVHLKDLSRSLYIYSRLSRGRYFKMACLNYSTRDTGPARGRLDEWVISLPARVRCTVLYTAQATHACGTHVVARRARGAGLVHAAGWERGRSKQ